MKRLPDTELEVMKALWSMGRRYALVRLWTKLTGGLWLGQQHRKHLSGPIG